MAVFHDVEGGDYDGSLGWAPDLFKHPRLRAACLFGSAWGNPNGFDYTFAGNDFTYASGDSNNPAAGIDARQVNLTSAGRRVLTPFSIEDLDTTAGLTLFALIKPTVSGGSMRWFSNYKDSVSAALRLHVSSNAWSAWLTSNESGSVVHSMVGILQSAGAAVTTNWHGLFATFMPGSLVKIHYRAGAIALDAQVATTLTKLGEVDSLFATANTSETAAVAALAMWEAALPVGDVNTEWAGIQALYAAAGIAI